LNLTLCFCYASKKLIIGTNLYFCIMILNINPDIKQSYTLPSEFYRSKAFFDTSIEKIFTSTWQYMADATVVKEPTQMHPFTFLEGVVDEPLVFTKDKNNKLHCLSNVCTHRGKVIVEVPTKKNMLSCHYHGRCFRLDGSFKSMPEFEQVEGFPTEEDNLSQIKVEDWLGLLFVNLEADIPFKDYIQPMQERLSFLPLDTLQYDASQSKDYFVDAHWALYCDNYLEGFHIPFVHPALNEALDFSQYSYEVFPYCNLQLGIADPEKDEACFDIPEGHVDYGKQVYAYYFWMFPNLMFNFYPWGLSLNVVQPLSHEKTKVSFRTYTYANTPHVVNETRLDDTEMEDEAVVESVQKGIQSRFYKRGRFSPTMEQGVHHFHQLVSTFMNK